MMVKSLVLNTRVSRCGFVNAGSKETHILEARCALRHHFEVTNITVEGRVMIAVGIDLGGTKIEAQLFDADWRAFDVKRVPTPKNYDALIDDLAGLVAWAEKTSGAPSPIGVGAAGLVNPVTGLTTAANLPTNGKPFHADLRAVVARPMTFLNDSQAMALSEAVFGAGKNRSRVLALVLGTGVSGGYAVNGNIQSGLTQTGGEFGHIAAPAHLVTAFGLPLVACGCGQIGCIETLISGAGLGRISETIMCVAQSPEQIIAARGADPDAQRVWDIWCALVGDLIRTLTRTLDPDCIILGGGLSKIAGVADDLMAAAQAAQFAGFDIAPIVIAKGGDASGARGAAYAAVMEAGREDA